MNGLEFKMDKTRMMKFALGGSLDMTPKPLTNNQSQLGEVGVGVASAFGPVAGGIAKAGVAIGKMSSKMTKDENGIYKSKGAEIADRVLNPLGTIDDLFLGGSGSPWKQKQLKEQAAFAQKQDMSNALM